MKERVRFRERPVVQYDWRLGWAKDRDAMVGEIRSQRTSYVIVRLDFT